MGLQLVANSTYVCINWAPFQLLNSLKDCVLGHTKLIPCSTEHQGNQVGSVGWKENKYKYDIISCY